MFEKKNVPDKKRVICIIPAYNEEKNIGKVIQKCQKYVLRIIVVDDGSNDNTLQVAQSMNVITVQNKQNKGKTEALKKGFNRALEEKAEILLMMDGDGQHNPEEIPCFLGKIQEGYDLVIGARKFDKQVMPAIRILANSISSFLVSLICGIRIDDSQSGYRAVRRKVIENFSLTSNRFQVDTEMIIKAAKCGFKIGFVPIKTIYHPEAKSKVHQIIDPLKFVALIIKLAFWQAPAKNSSDRFLLF